MNKKRKIYTVGGPSNYTNWMEGDDVENMQDADLVCFTGGADVSPKLYNERLGKYTYCDAERDDYEVKEFLRALRLKKKMIGICRGAQLLCVLAGGKLIQDLNHPGRHIMHSYCGNDILINSLHHQMMYPFNLSKNDYQILGWCNNISDRHLDGNNDDVQVPCEPEVVLFNKINALGIQCHPEMLFWFGSNQYDGTTIRYFREQLNNFMFDRFIKKKDNTSVYVSVNS